MAFPTYGTAATTETAFNSTTHTLNLPASLTSGRLLLAIISGADTASTVSTGLGDWTELYFNSGTGWRGAWAKIATGSEGATFDLTTSAGTRVCSVITQIDGWHGTIATGVEAAGTGYLGTDTQPRSGTALNPSNWGTEDTLWFGAYACDSTDTLSSGPTGYSAVANVGSNTNSSHIYLYSKTNAAASETPDTYTGAAARVGANITIGVRPAGSSALYGRNLLLGVG